MPRPTRTLRLREPVGGCKFASVNERRPFDAGFAGLCCPRLLASLGPLKLFLAIALLHHFHEVPHLVNHAAHRRRVLALDHLMHSPQAEAADGLTHIIGAADKADHPLDLHHAAGLLAVVLRAVIGLGGSFHARHFFSGHQAPSVPAAFSLGGLPLISSTVFERVSATCAMSFKPSNAAKVALTTLCGFDVPIDFVSTLVIPATCITLRTGPPSVRLKGLTAVFVLATFLPVIRRPQSPRL